MGVEGQVNCELHDLFDNEVSGFTNDIAGVVWGRGLILPLQANCEINIIF